MDLNARVNMFNQDSEQFKYVYLRHGEFPQQHATFLYGRGGEKERVRDAALIEERDDYVDFAVRSVNMMENLPYPLHTFVDKVMRHRNDGDKDLATLELEAEEWKFYKLFCRTGSFELPYRIKKVLYESRWLIYERRRHALIRWWRVYKIARIVEKVAKEFNLIYAEVTYRPGHKGAESAKIEFEALIPRDTGI